MVQQNRKKDGTIINNEATITDLGTLVIIDDPEPEDDDMDTMKSERILPPCGALSQFLS